jgi:cyclomaltodextrinase
MVQMEIIYNSKNQFYKSPFGAVSTGTPIVFKAEIQRKNVVSLIKLAIVKDQELVYSIEGWWSGLRLGFDVYRFDWMPDDPGFYLYSFEAFDANNKKTVGKTYQLTVYHENFNTPEWLGAGVMYQIFPDRFARSTNYQIPLMNKDYDLRQDWGGVPVFKPNKNGLITNNDFFGGNLRGIQEMLPYLKKLGTTVIYLNPIFEAYSNHRYDTADFRHIDSMLGTIEDFKELCSESLKLGIRIILDGVFNHTGSDSIYFNRNARYPEVGAYQSKESRYYPWYHFMNFPENYDAWWGIKTLPHVNELEPSYLDYMIKDKDSVIRFWLKNGASGFRLDVADELPSEFIKELRKAVNEEDPMAVIIGEVWEDASNKISYGQRRQYFQGEELDSVMNYPLKDAIIRFVAYENNAAALANIVENLWENYPKQVFNSLMNILGTHDTVRILTALGLKDNIYHMSKEEKAMYRLTPAQKLEAKRLLPLALLLWAFMPGIPCIYYGDEIGMEGAEDPFNRRCFELSKADEEIRSIYLAIFSFRNSIDNIGQYVFKPEEAKESLYIFSRSISGFKIIVAVNSGAKEELSDMNVIGGGQLVKYISFGGASLNDGNYIQTPERSGIVLYLKE